MKSIEKIPKKGKKESMAKNRSTVPLWKANQQCHCGNPVESKIHWKPMKSTVAHCKPIKEGYDRSLDIEINRILWYFSY